MTALAEPIPLPVGRPARACCRELRSRGFSYERSARLACVVDRQRSQFMRWELVRRLLGCSPVDARSYLGAWGYID